MTRSNPVRPNPVCLDQLRGRASGSGAWLLALMLLGGCSNAQFGSSLSSQPRPSRLEQPEGTTLRLPADKPFNITLTKAQKEPALQGTAEVTADTKDSGRADASASVTNGGTAEGIFQLGHSVSNSTDRQADFDFNINYRYQFQAQCTPEARLPDATIGLRLYARNDRGRLLRDIPLVTHSTENGAAQRDSSDSVHFRLTLAPGETVSVYLAGLSKIDAKEGRSASGQIELSDLKMEIATHPAPALQTTADEPH